MQINCITHRAVCFHRAAAVIFTHPLAAWLPRDTLANILQKNSCLCSVVSYIIHRPTAIYHTETHLHTDTHCKYTCLQMLLLVHTCHRAYAGQTARVYWLTLFLTHSVDMVGRQIIMLPPVKSDRCVRLCDDPLHGIYELWTAEVLSKISI